jgi:hypothetical protein
MGLSGRFGSVTTIGMRVVSAAAENTPPRSSRPGRATVASCRSLAPGRPPGRRRRPRAARRRDAPAAAARPADRPPVRRVPPSSGTCPSVDPLLPGEGRVCGATPGSARAPRAGTCAAPRRPRGPGKRPAVPADGRRGSPRAAAGRRCQPVPRRRTPRAARRRDAAALSASGSRGGDAPHRRRQFAVVGGLEQQQQRPVAARVGAAVSSTPPNGAEPVTTTTGRPGRSARNARIRSRRPCGAC